MANINSSYKSLQIELLLSSWLVVIIDFIFSFDFLFFGGYFLDKNYFSVFNIF